jgi:MFS family permease
MHRFELLGREPLFRRLFAARLASELGTWLAYVALSVEVYRRTGSTAWVGALLMAEFLPAIVIGLALGPLVDRLPRRRLLVACDLVNAAVFVAIPFAPGAGAIVALAVVSGFAVGFFRPALRAGLPNLVEERDLPNATSLAQTVETLALLAGPVVGGILVAGVGPDPAYWANAASFLVSATLLARIPAARLHAAARVGESHWRAVRRGFRVIARTPLLLSLLAAAAFANLATAGMNVTEIVLAQRVFGAGDVGFGIIASACGLGLVAGCLAAGSLAERIAPPRLLAGALVVGALGSAGTAVSPSFWLAVAFVVVGTAGNGVGIVSRTLIVQQAVPDEVRGRAFALLSSSGSVFVVGGTLAFGVLAGPLGGRAVWGLSAILLLAAAAVVAVRCRADVAPVPAPARV